MAGSETSRCPLCGGMNTYHYTDCRDSAVSGESYSLARCPDCGLIHTLNPPTDEDKSAYSKLSQELNRADHPKEPLDKLYFHTRFLNVRRRVRIVKEQSRLKTGRLLNYGAKSGYFSNAMENRGWKVSSLEEHHEKRVFSLEMFHHRMMEPDELESLPRESFDEVTLWHTLEHQNNPGKLIEKLKTLLKPNGLMFIALPNTDSLDAAWYGNDWAAWDVPRHLWHFNINSMIRFGLQHGLILQHHQQLPLDTFYIAMLSERNRGTRHYILKGGLKGLHFWLKTRRDRKGSSTIVYVFRKRTNGLYDNPA